MFVSYLFHVSFANWLKVKHLFSVMCSWWIALGWHRIGDIGQPQCHKWLFSLSFTRILF